MYYERLGLSIAGTQLKNSKNVDERVPTKMIIIPITKKARGGLIILRKKAGRNKILFISIIFIKMKQIGHYRSKKIPWDELAMGRKKLEVWTRTFL